MDSFWKAVMTNLSDNPDSIIPVIIQDPATRLNAGRFYVSIAKEQDKLYLQVENVSDEFGEAVDDWGWGKGWETLIGGIYRLPLTSPLLNR
jgi:hypothetical protein